MNAVGHCDAQQVYEKLKTSMPNLSLGTVYRNLNLLTENGQLNKLSLPDGNDMFEPAKKPHSHVICTKCGHIFDVELPLFGWMDDMVFQQTGVKVNERYLLARGICKSCAAKTK